jgi:hypothetical protein
MLGFSDARCAETELQIGCVLNLAPSTLGFVRSHPEPETLSRSAEDTR